MILLREIYNSVFQRRMLPAYILTTELMWNAVDHLQLGGNGHGQSRQLHTLHDELQWEEAGGKGKSYWKVTKLNP